MTSEMVMAEGLGIEDGPSSAIEDCDEEGETNAEGYA